MPTKHTDDFERPNPRIPRTLMIRIRRVAEREYHSLNDEIIIAIEAHVGKKERTKRR